MSLISWIPSITTTALLALVLWLGRNLIATRLTKSVEHEFNARLESLRSEIRKNEELFKADLRSKETEIATLRGGAITAMASRQVALDKRRLEAVDQLWSAVTALGKGKGILALMTAVKFEAAVELASKNAKAREMFTGMDSGFDLNKVDLSDSDKARPFVSPMAWALFSAYRSIIAHAALKLTIIKSGIDLDPTKLIDKDAITKLVKAALPHRSEYIDKFSDSGFHYLMEEIEEKLLDELRKMLAGVESDKESIEQAANILKISDEVMGKGTSSAPSEKGPDVPRP